jgi:hypothetical protein
MDRQQTGQLTTPASVWRGLQPSRPSAGRRGQSIIEACFMVPWILFIFMAVIDIGFYSYAAINVENAARAAVLITSGNRAFSQYPAAAQAAACAEAVRDLWMLRTLAATPFTAAHTCAAGTSLVVTVADPAPASLDGVPGDIDSVVTVRYQMLPMIPVPGITGNFTIERSARMKVNTSI